MKSRVSDSVRRRADRGRCPRASTWTATRVSVDDQSMAQLDAILVQPASVTPLNDDEMEQDGYKLSSNGA